MVIPKDEYTPDRVGLARWQGERHALAVALLLLLFMLVLAEPLICVRYCHTEMQLGAHSRFAAQRQPHELAPHTGMAAELTDFRPVLSPNLFVCFTDVKDGFPSDMPNRLVAVEQHDHQATTVAIPQLILILAILRHRISIPRTSPHGVVHPLLRPPIALPA